MDVIVTAGPDSSTGFASVQLSDTQPVIDEAAFRLADARKPIPPKHIVPGKTTHTPAAKPNVQVQPASPIAPAPATPPFKSILPKHQQGENGQDSPGRQTCSHRNEIVTTDQ
jgi:hypothetical protein